MQVAAAQKRLGLNADGVLGPKTWTGLFKAAGASQAQADAMAPVLAASEINTPLRACHFLAQAAHETGGFKWLKEIWGPTTAQAGYEGRKDLGNVMRGDGKLYMGRGIFQLTGRANYTAMSVKVGTDLIANPERAAEPATAAKIAVLYWASRSMSPAADRDDVIACTKKVNGGLNGLADRQARLAKLKALFA